MVKTLPSNAGGAGSNPHQGTKIPHALWTKKQNIKRSNIVTNSIKIKKKKKKNVEVGTMLLTYCRPASHSVFLPAL